MFAHAEVGLRDGVDAEPFGDVDDEPELDAPALHERDRLEHLAPARVLARQRLHEARQLREQRTQQRAGHELGDAAAAGRFAVQRSVVVPLHERDGRIGEQRFEQPGDEVRPEVADVGVEPADRGRPRRRTATSTARCPSRSRRGARAGCPRRRGRSRRPTGPPRRWRRWSRRRGPRSRRRDRPPRPAPGARWPRCGRRSPPRRGPGGTPRRSGPAGPWPRRGRRGRDRESPGGGPEASGRHVLGKPTGRRDALCYGSSSVRAHRERPRDRPCDAAATSFHRETGPPRPEIGGSQVPMPDR